MPPTIEELIRAAVRDEIEANLRPYLHKLRKPEPLVYKVADVVTILQVSNQTVRDMINDGRLPKLPGMGSRILIPRVAVDALVSGTTP